MTSRLEEIEAAREGRRGRRERRRRRRRNVLVAVLGGIALGVAVWAGVRYVVSRPDPAPDPTVQASDPAPTPPPVEPQDTLLLVRYDETEQVAQSVTLLAAGSDAQDPIILFIPVGTYVEIPGYGLERLSQAHLFGGAALVEASVESLLGIAVDSTAATSNESLGVFLERTGGLEVEVPEQLVRRAEDGTAEVRFQPGVQFLDGPRLVELWGFSERGDSELTSFANQQLVWDALLTALQDDEVTEALVGDGAPQLATDADPEDVRSLLTGMAEAHGADQLTFTLLPVEPFGESDQGSTYQTKDADVAELVAGPLAGSVPQGGGDAVEIQILNGVGTPGIGTAVDRALEGGGFRTVLTDNARSFDYDETLILIYSEDADAVAAAERVQQRLGVGTIQVSRQPQSLVDLTIVVGADFQPPPEASDGPTEAEEQPT